MLASRSGGCYAPCTQGYEGGYYYVGREGQAEQRPVPPDERRGEGAVIPLPSGEVHRLPKTAYCAIMSIAPVALPNHLLADPQTRRMGRMHIFQSRPHTRKHRHTYQNVNCGKRGDDVRGTHNDRIPDNGLQHRTLKSVRFCIEVTDDSRLLCVAPPWLRWPVSTRRRRTRRAPQGCPCRR